MAKEKENCSVCNENELKQIKIGDIGVWHCEKCDGYWFDKDELRKVKDEKLDTAKWFDFDLWKDFSRLNTEKSKRICPVDNEDLYTLNYSDSDIRIDVCKKCYGIWLDKGELKKIIQHVRNKSDYEILHNYAKNYFNELGEIFTGPEGVRSEINDFLIISSMFKYKFLTEHPYLSEFLLKLPH